MKSELYTISWDRLENDKLSFCIITKHTFNGSDVIGEGKMAMPIEWPKSGSIKFTLDNLGTIPA